MSEPSGYRICPDCNDVHLCPIEGRAPSSPQTEPTPEPAGSDFSTAQIQLLAWATTNCHMLARRALARTTSAFDREKWEHVLRICEKAGARSAGVLRLSLPTELTEGADSSPSVPQPTERRIAQRRSEANTARSESGPERRSFKERRAASSVSTPRTAEPTCICPEGTPHDPNCAIHGDFPASQGDSSAASVSDRTELERMAIRFLQTKPESPYAHEAVALIRELLASLRAERRAVSERLEKLTERIDSIATTAECESEDDRNSPFSRSIYRWCVVHLRAALRDADTEKAPGTSLPSPEKPE